MTPEQIKMLNEPLDPKHVNPPKKFGPKGDYIEGWHCVAELNRIFGFDGWSYTINLTRDDLREAKDKDGKPQWQAAYTCICTLNVSGVTRQDVGFGSGFAKTIGDAIEGATKEAATDALKRAARTFGNPFGLALYDKSRANVCAPKTPMIDDQTRDEIIAMAGAAGVDPKTICERSNVGSLIELTQAQADKVRAKLRLNLVPKNEKEAA